MLTNPSELNPHEYDVALGPVRLRVRDVGDRDAPAFLFLHGVMGHRREWDVLIDALAACFRVVSIDQRGHGESAWAENYRASEMAADAIGVIDLLDLAPVRIVGHSMGGMVGLLVAARCPELVERLIVVDIVPGSLRTQFAQQMPQMLEAMAESSYGSVEEATEEWQANNPLARADLLRNYVSHALVPAPDGRLSWSFDAMGLRRFVAGVSPAELWHAIDSVRCPSLVVRGEYSPLTSRGQAIQMAKRLGGAPVVEITGGGHDLGVEQPEAVTRAILSWMDEPDRGRPGQPVSTGTANHDSAARVV